MYSLLSCLFIYFIFRKNGNSPISARFILLFIYVCFYVLICD